MAGYQKGLNATRRLPRCLESIHYAESSAAAVAVSA